MEIHAGMQKIGELRRALSGLTLERMSDAFLKRTSPSAVRVVRLEAPPRRRGQGGGKTGTVLLIRDGVRLLGVDPDALRDEFRNQTPDQRFLNTRQKKVMKKRARWNFNVGDSAQAPDYAQGKGTTIAFGDMPVLAQLRAALGSLLEPEDPDAPLLRGLLAEANWYHSLDSGIGFHGDTERTIVVGVNVAKDETVERALEFQSFADGLPSGERTRLTLRHGDIYAMCGTAAGYDWKEHAYKAPHFRHRAGFPVWLDRNERENRRKWLRMAEAAEAKEERQGKRPRGGASMD